MPTAVSAIKVDGKRAYERVREGEEVELAARRVTVHELDGPRRPRRPERMEVDLSVRCSSGTYVRAIARDAGAALGVGGHLTALRRTAVGPFGLGRGPHPRGAAEDVRAGPDRRRRPGAPSRPTTSTSSRRPTSASAARSPSTLPGVRPVAVFAPDGEFLALYEQAGERRPGGGRLHRLTGDHDGTVE